MQIPGYLERAIGDAVARHLETELIGRHLVLGRDELAAAEVEAAQLGERLFAGVIQRCYPHIGREASVAFGFDSDHTATRLHAALAFGAVTASVLSAPATGGTRVAEVIELLSAMFNVGIGLIDDLCDEDRAMGRQLLALLVESDLAMAAEHELLRHWLCAKLPPPLARDATVAFTAEIIEGFFATLHAAYPRAPGSRLRRAVAAQLTTALQAERVSTGSLASYPRERLLECSRLTSVLPFEITERLVGGDTRLRPPTQGTLLGEAVWQIDDLVDLCQDARSGALNSLLIGAARGSWHPDDERTVLNALERLLASDDIADAAALAAHRLLLGLEGAGERGSSQDRDPATLVFLGFIQDYAGVPARAS